MHKFILLLVTVVHIPVNCFHRQPSCPELTADCPLSEFIFKKDKLFVNFLNYQKCYMNVQLKMLYLNGYFHRMLFTNSKVIMSEVLFLSI